MSSQAAEAKEHYAQAQKSLKTSYLSLKFSPDHLTASMEFANAATKFRAANMLPECVDAWLQSAKSKEEQNDVFGAGRAYESAGAVCDGKGPGGPEAAAVHWEKAVRCFRLANKSDLAVKLIMKLAAAHEQRGDLAKTKEAYQTTIEIYEQDEKDYNLSDTYKQYVGFLLRHEMHKEALGIIDAHIGVLTRQKQFYFVHKELLAKAVILLKMQDTVSAEQALAPDGEAPEGWFMSKECQAGMELVTAFQSMDAEAADRWVKDQIFTSLQVEVARIAKSLHVVTTTSSAGYTAAASTAAPSKSPADTVEDEAPPSAAATHDPKDLADLLM